jgi:tetratricopeptide (TPR) repeat protein
MGDSFSVRFSSAVLHPYMMAVVLLLFAIAAPYVVGQEEKGCDGVRYAKRPHSDYSSENLKRRLERNPGDVDALIHTGLRLEEQDEFDQAYALYKRAIQARPDCSLGYLFAGLVGERISEKMIAEAEANVRQAISLNPKLRHDGNVQGFMKQHSRTMGGYVPLEKQQPSEAVRVLATASRFYIGLGVGVLLAACAFYLARFRRTGRVPHFGAKA